MVTTGLLVKACRKRKQGCTSKMSFRVFEHAPSRYASVAQESRVRANAAGEELRPLFGRTLLPSVLDRAIKGEL